MTLAGLGAIYLSIWQLGEETGRLPRPGNELAMRLALLKAQLPNYRLTPNDVDAARRAATEAPLAHEPFFIAARAAEQAGRLPEAMRLMEEARRRRPSFAVARLMLMGYYARSGRYADAITEADVTMRLSSEAEKAILPVLVDMLPYREARPGLARILAGEPKWRPQFLEIAEDKVSPEAAAAFLAELRRLKPAARTLPEASLLVASLVRAGRYAEAYRTWLGLVPPGARNDGVLVFDGDFHGLPAPAPFNWTFAGDEKGRAEPAAGGSGEAPHLAASYFGGSETILAEQVLVLAPGAYRLSVRAKADRKELSGQMFWRLTCLPAKNEIGRLPLPRFADRYAAYRTGFTVPAECGAQSLALVAQPGDLTQPINVDLAQLRVERGQ